MNNQQNIKPGDGPIFLTVHQVPNPNELITVGDKNRADINNNTIYQTTTTTTSNIIRPNVINGSNLIQLNNISNMSTNNPQIMQLLGETLIKQTK